jgi:signal transduction histidine kinase
MVRGIPLLNTDGSCKEWVGTCIDITERKQSEETLVKSRISLQEALEDSNRGRQTLLSVLEDQRVAEREIQKLNAELEQRVKTRTAQLEALNKELETFTYSVSHDLKAPLRGIDGYSKLLLDIHGKNLDEEAKAFISTIRSSTMQMNQLIEDLLEYSRLERSNLSNEKVKLIALIDSITTLYKNDLINGKFLLKLDIPDVELITDEKGLTIVLRNILENAIKFTKEKSNPTIEIGFTDQPTSCIIRVKDNGIGFDMKYHQRIFEIFQRLHRAEDYVGTGIGLAMVSKGMQRLNGKVWAESIPGEGSTFYLEIPKL